MLESAASDDDAVSVRVESDTPGEGNEDIDEGVVVEDIAVHEDEEEADEMEVEETEETRPDDFAAVGAATGGVTALEEAGEIMVGSGNE